MKKFKKEKIDREKYYLSLDLPEPLRSEIALELSSADMFTNDIYCVHVWRNEFADNMVHKDSWKGEMTYLSIKRHDKKAIHDWRHLQQIKSEIVGGDREAMEIYPKESRVVDTANQYYLFVFPKGYQIPLGFLEGHRNYETNIDTGIGRTGQRGKEKR